MEVSLSFDNAVINAAILQTMTPIWQRRFLTWGIAIAVIGMRLLFPILIVCAASGLSISNVAEMAINYPVEYGQKLAESHIGISAFGGTFLLMIFLNFICDSTKEIHWISFVEKKLSTLGLLKGSEIIIATTALICVQHLLPNPQERLNCLLSGLSGISLYMLLQALLGIFDGEKVTIAARGLTAFIYLEIVDASCSFDGVIGAFVLTNNIIVIMVGLGIGAVIIRSLTLYLVHGGILKEYIYLEHGAHYGIGALAIIMLIDIVHAVPEPVTGMIGISFIGLSLLSSIKQRR